MSCVKIENFIQQGDFKDNEEYINPILIEGIAFRFNPSRSNNWQLILSGIYEGSYIYYFETEELGRANLDRIIKDMEN